MNANIKDEPQGQHPPVHREEPPRWEFGDLLDADAQGELRDFYRAMEKSKDCNTVLVGYTPPRD